MKKRTMNLKARNSMLLLLTALVWGVAFVAQRQGGASAGPYTFNCIRSFLGGLVLLPVIPFLDRYTEGRKPQSAQDRRRLSLGGALCGLVLFVASTLQQMGMYYGTTAGKAGFLTACYILLVPVLGIFSGRGADGMSGSALSWRLWGFIFSA